MRPVAFILAFAVAVPLSGGLRHLCNMTGSSCCCPHMAEDNEPDFKRIERPECCRLVELDDSAPLSLANSASPVAAADAVAEPVVSVADARWVATTELTPPIRGPPAPEAIYLRHRSLLL